MPIRRRFTFAGILLLCACVLGAAKEPDPPRRSLAEEVAALEKTIDAIPAKGEPAQQFLYFGVLGVGHRPPSTIDPETAKKLRILAARLGVNSLPEQSAPQRNQLSWLPGPLESAAGVQRDLAGWIANPARLRAIVGRPKAPLPPTGDAAGFRRFLVGRAYKPDDLGLKSLEEAVLEFNDKKSRLYYPSHLFQLLAGIRPAGVGEEVAGAGVQVGDWSESQRGILRPSYAADLFPYRQSRLTLPWQTDRVCAEPELSPQAQGLGWSCARSAARYLEQPFMASLTASSALQNPTSLRRAYYQALGHGAKMFHFQGAVLPGQVSDVFASINPEDVAQWRTIRDLIHETGLVEKIAFPAQPRPAHIAFLLSFAEELRGHPETVAEELKALYVCCRQAGYAVDVVGDDEVQRGRLENYKAVFFVGNYLERKTALELKRWVATGRVLAGYAGGGMFDEHGQPMDILHEVYGITDPKLNHVAALSRAKIELPEVKRVDTIQTNFEGVRFKFPALLAKETFGVSPRAVVCGQYADGSPAIVRNAVGQGTALLYGSYVGLGWAQPAIPKRAWKPGPALGDFNHFVPLDFVHDLGDQIVAGSDDSTFHVMTDNLSVETLVLEGPKGLALVCINWAGEPQAAFLTVQFAGPQYKKATSLERGALKMTKLSDPRNPRAVTYNFRLKVNETDVVMLEE